MPASNSWTPAQAGPPPAGPGLAAPAGPAPAGRRRPGRLTPVVGTARKMLREALAAAGYPARVLVACSGGPDSLALAAVAAHFARRGHVDGHPVSVGAVVVDHQLQPGSAGVAAAAAAALAELGIAPVQIRRVEVAAAGTGPEAAAREARHAALDAAADDLDAGVIMLGHTLDDQAEQVLLGLARGSGTRSLAGMRPARGRLLRPFLGLRRAETLEICAAEGLEPWHDPSNADPAFARSRTRVEVLPVLEEKLGPGVAESLARTAAILQSDADYLDGVADGLFTRLRERSGADIHLPESSLRELAPALRFRVIARAAAAVGGQQPSHRRLLAAEALLRRQGSAGPVELPGGVSVYRQSLAEQLAEAKAAQAGAPEAGAPAAGAPDAAVPAVRGPRDGAPCGKLIFRPQQPPQI